MEGSDEVSQKKSHKYSAYQEKGKLLLQINDTITYKGQIQSSPYYDLNELKNIFQKEEIQVINKTTSKMNIKLGFLKIQLLSDQNRQMLEMKKKIQQLQEKLATQGMWENQNLDSKDNFDLNYVYRIDVSAGYSCLTLSVSAANLFFYGGNGGAYNVANSNRRTCTAGWTVTKIVKKKI